ncbi:MAG: hypothetical protein ICV64_05720 [Thermoleophilia bacterium]|nr:hypothetical protein [Thermoleophilia bacterium]
MSEPERPVVTVSVDPRSDDAERARGQALALVRARGQSVDAYEHELATTTAATLSGHDLSSNQGVDALARRVAVLVDALAGLGWTAGVYAAGKLDVPADRLLEAIAKSLDDAAKGRTRPEDAAAAPADESDS